MNITIPALPLGIVTLLAFFGPYAVGALNGVLPFVTKPWQKKLVSIVVSVLLAAAVIVIFAFSGGELPTTWPALVIWSVVVLAASYAFVLRSSAARVERAIGGEGTPPYTTADVANHLK